MADTPTYGHQDIVRYLERQMSGQEMHAFEKALMDDPFLADALEGYAGSNPQVTARHLEEISAKLSGTRVEAPVVPLVRPRRNWMRVAVLVAVVAAGGLGTYFLRQFPAPVTPLSQTQPASEPAKQPESTAPVVSSAPLAVTGKQLNGSAGAGNDQMLRSSKTGRIKQPPKPSPAPAYTLSDSMALVATNAPVQFAQRSSSPIYRVRPDSTRNQTLQPGVLTEFKGRVTDAEGEGVASAAILDSQGKQTGLTDLSGNFLLRLPDTVARVTINSVGFTPVTARLQKEQPLNIIRLEKNSQALSETVVSGYGNFRKATTVPADSAGTAEPIGGWNRFGQYLHAQIDSLQAKESNYNYAWENVELEFSVDDDGKPVDIKVKKDVDAVTASKAVEILAKGPRWKMRKKDKKVKVVIPFKAGN